MKRIYQCVGRCYETCTKPITQCVQFYFLNRLHLMKMGKWTSIVDFVIIIKEVMNQLVGIGYIV